MKIEMSREARQTLKKLDRQMAKRITDYLEKVAALDDPTSCGEGLSRNLAGCYRYRIGDYRAICRIYKSKMLISVIKIGHRSIVYKYT